MNRDRMRLLLNHSRNSRSMPLIDGVLGLTVRLDDGDVHYHLHRDPLAQYVPLTCTGATLVRYSAS
jgi:hypothetical protein